MYPARCSRSAQVRHRMLRYIGSLHLPSFHTPCRKPSGHYKFLGTASAVEVPEVLSLSGLVDMLRQPGPLRDGTPRVYRPDLRSLPDPVRFDERLWAEADRLLDLDGTERTLGQLLTEAAMIHPELPKLVALRAHCCVAPGIGEAQRRGRPPVLVAAPTGDLLPGGGDHAGGAVADAHDRPVIGPRCPSGPRSVGIVEVVRD